MWKLLIQFFFVFLFLPPQRLSLKKKWAFIPVMLAELLVSQLVKWKGKIETELWPQGFWQHRGQSQSCFLSDPLSLSRPSALYPRLSFSLHPPSVAVLSHALIIFQTFFHTQPDSQVPAFCVFLLLLFFFPIQLILSRNSKLPWHAPFPATSTFIFRHFCSFIAGSLMHFYPGC